MALKEQFGSLPSEQVDVMANLFSEQNDPESQMLCVIETAQQYANLLAEDLAVAYGDPSDPDIGITAWDIAWCRVEATLTASFYDTKLRILTDIDAVIRDTRADIDPLGFPTDHEDPSIATFYERFGKNLPKPISKDTHIGRRADWGY
ncbi:MAG: hypothetical protein ABIQ89_01000 [Candidatus Saccharimonadales bacterium]